MVEYTETKTISEGSYIQMGLEELTKPLPASDIQVRIAQSVEGRGFSLLLYKTARADVKRLNEVFNAMWSNSWEFDEKGNLVASITVNGITRSDVGTESNTEEVKGQYSDAFKRAGFKWGIGLELYDAPFIWVNWDDWRGKKPNFYTQHCRVQFMQPEKGLLGGFTILYKNTGIYQWLPQNQISVVPGRVDREEAPTPTPAPKPEPRPNGAKPRPTAVDDF